MERKSHISNDEFHVFLDVKDYKSVRTVYEVDVKSI